MAGYSKRSLVEKLGMKAGWKVLIFHPPANYETLLGELPENVQPADKPEGEFEFIQLFTTDRKEWGGIAMMKIRWERTIP
jgi:hypothetical protein